MRSPIVLLIILRAYIDVFVLELIFEALLEIFMRKMFHCFADLYLQFCTEMDPLHSARNLFCCHRRLGFIILDELPLLITCLLIFCILLLDLIMLCDNLPCAIFNFAVGI